MTRREERADRIGELAAKQPGRHLYFTERWKMEREQFLALHEWCWACWEKRQIRTRATVVDHVEPHRGDPAKFWDRSNWQALCRSCHSRKSVTHDGGFGRKRKPWASR